MANRTRTKNKGKQEHQHHKPYPEFPLTAHPSGRWAKKHKGTRYYFGKVDDGWKPALEKYEHDWPCIIENGCQPVDDPHLPPGEACTFAVLCNEFLNAKRRLIESRELSPRSLADYLRTTDRLIKQFGKSRKVDTLKPSDFASFRSKLAKKYNAVTLRNEVTRVRSIFKFAFDQQLIEKPVAFGQSFEKPSAKTLRKVRNEAGPKLFESAEIRMILSVLDGEKVVLDDIDGTTGKPIEVQQQPDPVLKAIVLLATNAAFGNSDVASLPQSAIVGDWINFARVKTGINRRIPLWSETRAAIEAAIEVRPEAKNVEDSDLCFLTRFGRPWVRMKRHQKTGRPVPVDALTQKFSRLLKRLKINGRRNLGLYTIRHNFQTIGGDARDPDAVSAIMGHVDTSMGAVYRERIADERLQAVVQVVHDWLFGE